MANKDLIVKSVDFEDGDIYDMSNHQSMMDKALNSVKDRKQFEIKNGEIHGGKGMFNGTPIEVSGSVLLDDLVAGSSFEQGFICLYIEQTTNKAKPTLAQFQFLETVPNNEINTLKDYVLMGGDANDFSTTNKTWTKLYSYNKSTKRYKSLRNGDFFFDVEIESNGATLNLDINGVKSNLLNVDLNGITQRVLTMKDLGLSDNSFLTVKFEGGFYQVIFDKLPNNSQLKTYVGSTKPTMLNYMPFKKAGMLTVSKFEFNNALQIQVEQTVPGFTWGGFFNDLNDQGNKWSGYSTRGRYYGEPQFLTFSDGEENKYLGSASSKFNYFEIQSFYGNSSTTEIDRRIIKVDIDPNLKNPKMHEIRAMKRGTPPNPNLVELLCTFRNIGVLWSANGCRVYVSKKNSISVIGGGSVGASTTSYMRGFRITPILDGTIRDGNVLN